MAKRRGKTISEIKVGDEFYNTKIDNFYKVTQVDHFEGDGWAMMFDSQGKWIDPQLSDFVKPEWKRTN